MDKELYDFLNDMDIVLDRYEKEKLSEFAESKYKQNISKRIKEADKRLVNKSNNKLNKESNNWGKRIIVIAASLILLLAFRQTRIGKDAYTMASELFANIKYGIKEGFGFIDDIDKYSSKIGLVSESEGIKMKLNDVVIDRDKIYFSLLVDVSKYISKEDLANENNQFVMSFLNHETQEVCHKMTIEDIEIYGFSYTTRIGSPSRKYKDGHSLEAINYKEIKEKGIFDILIIADNPLEQDIEDLEDIDFNLVFNYFSILCFGKGYEPVEEIYGDWEFEFTRNVEDFLIETAKFKLGEILILDDLEIELIELTSNPLGSKIEAKIKDQGLYEEEVGTIIVLDGYDNLGQRRSFDFTLDEGENTIIIEEFYNYIEYPQNIFIPDSNYPESNLDFTGVEYIEFTPYYKIEEKGHHTKWDNPIEGSKKLGDSFKLYLNGE